MLRVRTDKWDDATRREWDDIKRWSSGAVIATFVVAVWLLADLITTSYLPRLGVAAVGAVVVAFVGGWVHRRWLRSRAAGRSPAGR